MPDQHSVQAGRPRTVSDDAILEAAARVIGRHGPGRLTLAHVADEVGLAPATLLQRFGSKRGLLLAVAARGPGAAERAFAAARAGCRAPLAAAVAALVALAGELDGPETLANHIAFLQLDLSDPELRRHATAHARVVQAQLRELLDAAAACGELASCDRARLAEALAATYNGALVTWAIAGEGPLVDWLRARLEFTLEPYRAAR